MCRSLEDGGFRLASKRDLALSSALQSESQRVLRSEVVVDESRLVDLLTRPGAATAASTRVLIFWKGASVEERVGGLFLEKLDYLQGEYVSSVISFWKDLARVGRDSALGGWASVQAVMSRAVQSSWSWTDDTVRSQINVTKIGSRIASSGRLASSGSAWRGLGSDTGVAGVGRGRAGRIRSRRLGSISVLTPDEVVRQSTTLLRASRRRGVRSAAMGQLALARRWGLVRSQNRPLQDFMPGGSWAPSSGKLALIETAAMKISFSLAMRSARGNLTDVRASYWRVLLSAFLRPVRVLDPSFEQVVVIYARTPHMQSIKNATLDEGLWTNAASSILGSIDPGLPAAVGFPHRPAGGGTSSNVTGFPSTEGNATGKHNLKQYLKQYLASDGRSTIAEDADTRNTEQASSVADHAALPAARTRRSEATASNLAMPPALAQAPTTPPCSGYSSAGAGRERSECKDEREGRDRKGRGEDAAISLSVLAYKGVKVQSLRTLFPDRQLRFRPLFLKVLCIVNFI